MTHEFWLVLSPRVGHGNMQLVFRHQCDLGFTRLAAIDTTDTRVAALKRRQQQYDRLFEQFDAASVAINKSLKVTALSAKPIYLERVSLADFAEKVSSREEFELKKSQLKLRHKLIDFYWALTIKNAFLNWAHPGRLFKTIQLDGIKCDVKF